jgi:Pretoxin HINT domain
MADGTIKPISDVQVGDMVVATNPETGESGARRVTATWPHQDHLFDLELHDGSRITTTEDHHFWNSTDREWQESRELDAGDALRSASGDTVTVDGLDWDSGEWAAAYDLSVEDLHSYYVKAESNVLLVHNCNITFGHGERHLKADHPPRESVERAIRDVVEATVSSASSTGSFWGRVKVGETTIEFRAYTLDDGTINVGTYYVP